MEYIKPTFTIAPPKSTAGIFCEACVYPEAAKRLGIKHSKTCHLRKAARMYLRRQRAEKANG